jgi:hypothetical protein
VVVVGRRRMVEKTKREEGSMIRRVVVDSMVMLKTRRVKERKIIPIPR